MNTITVDAIYSQNANISRTNGDNYVAEDFSQIFLDFNMTNLKRVTEKVLFVSSLEIDNMGPCESINLDNKGFFMFDMSQ